MEKSSEDTLKAYIFYLTCSPALKFLCKRDGEGFGIAEVFADAQVIRVPAGGIADWESGMIAL